MSADAEQKVTEARIRNFELEVREFARVRGGLARPRRGFQDYELIPIDGPGLVCCL